MTRVPAPSPAEEAVARAAAARDARLDPQTRRRFGVVHTPLPVARYAAERAFFALGASELGPGAPTVLDPACGPGVFLAAALGCWEGPPGRLLGFERDAEALAAAAEALTARRAGWSLRLERTEDTLATLPELEPGGPLVVLGNPPWAGKTASRSPLSEALLEDFRREADGTPLEEQKLGVLSDAYVRFLRWGAELLRREPGGGVLAFVTNASFLDGPVHRGLRAAFGRWFSTIEITDLGGSALVAREPGHRDDNVFGVRPAAAVCVATRPRGHDEAGSTARVSLRRIRGDLEGKLAALTDAAPVFVPLEPQPPALLWRAAEGLPWPVDWVPLPALFPFHREGVQTNRDDLVTHRDPDVLVSRLQALALGLRRPDLERAFEALPHFDPRAAQAAAARALAAHPAGEGVIRRLAYRPGAPRHVIALAPLCHRPRPALLAAMDASRRALLTVRKDRGERRWTHGAMSDAAPDNCYLSSRSSCRTRAYPERTPERAPNLSDRARAALSAVGADEDDALGLLRYALAVLRVPAYGARFAGVLRADHPRVPLPTKGSWASLREAGATFEAELLAADRGPVAAGGASVAIGHRQLVLGLGAAGRWRAAEAIAAQTLAPSFPARAPDH
ncbi:MAG: type ISP restriction/modification enzyme [Myxococcota bacterium]